MRVFISQASRNAAHNLDDLSERWQLRKEGARYSVLVPDNLPNFRSASDARLYRSELSKIRMGLQLDLQGAKGNVRQETLKQINHVQSLQIALKVAIQQLDPLIAEAGVIRAMIRDKQLLIHANENETIFVFPTVKQSIVIPRIKDGDS